MYVKGAQRYHWQGVFHLTLAQGVASRELQTVGWVVRHAQIATANEVDIVGVVSIQCAHHMSLLIDTDTHVHAEAVDVGSFHGVDGCGVGEVGEADEIFQFAISGECRLAQHIGHIGITQHIKPATHLQGRERSLHHTEEVDICLAVEFRAWVLLGIDQQEVACAHPHVKHHLVHVGEVETALYVQRAVVIGIYLEVLKEHLAILYPHRILTKTHGHAIGFAIDIRGVEQQLAVDVKAIERSLYGEIALAGAP